MKAGGAFQLPVTDMMAEHVSILEELYPDTPIMDLIRQAIRDAAQSAMSELEERQREQQRQIEAQERESGASNDWN